MNKELGETIRKMEQFHEQMRFREYMSENYCFKWKADKNGIYKI